ncbi:MAG: quinone-dependent dihydroorotate dehydrogenase [Candidatus Magasanikbacteria bacterium]|nr:quinone-dependent dihydroorotate dehydrogenase [Candidatus Magasanikbacteria bacterium]
MYKSLIFPILSQFDAEEMHEFIFSLLKIIFYIPGIRWLTKKIYTIEDPELECTVFGLKFKNPIGLAAGLDKGAELFEQLACFGFGFIEIGTVTPLPQPGNDRPRLFRLKKDEALINRMGFNGEGVKVVVNRLKKRKNHQIIIGGNIGKNKITSNEDAIKDYEICFNEMFDWVDYFVVNVSSPNTPGLRALQDKEPLAKLLVRLQELNAQREKPKPILLKIAPDLTNEQLDDIIEIIKETKLDGVVATNTTISRDHLKTSPEIIEKIGAGGLSGKPLTIRSTEVVKYLAEKSGNAFPIIAVGGIHNAADAIEKIKAGATLVQIYTGFIYEGPALIKKINKEILSTELV